MSANSPSKPGRLLARYAGSTSYPARRLLRFVLQDLVVATVLSLRSLPGAERLARRLAPAGGARWRQMLRGYETRGMRADQEGPLYWAPTDLALTATPLKRLLTVGACFSHEWAGAFEEANRGVHCDFVLANFVSQLPENPPHPAADYDFQLVQIPLKSVLPDAAWACLPHDDGGAHERFLQEAEERLAQLLSAALRWNTQHGLLTFVANFMLPQQNPLGRLLPRYDLANPMHFIERLNESLARELARYRDVHLLDIDQIAAGIGRKYVQDDGVANFSSGDMLNDYFIGFDRTRLEPTVPVTEHYVLRRRAFMQALWAEAVAAFRTLRNIDAVKLVAVDLDDTLWRGIVVEEGDVGEERTEGWPRGLAEALVFLKKRGVMLAIVSRNEEARIVQLWDRLMTGMLRLDDFAFRKINWRPKTENLEEVIREANLLARSVVYIDDNPVEREAAKAALPGLRVLGSHPYYLRRILLWAPETQVPTVTQESARRTEMMQAQAERETVRKRMSRGEFLASLEVTVRMLEIGAAGDPRFARALELVNKTNQFNTTGERWTQAEFAAAQAEGRAIYAFEVTDRFTPYGLVGVVLAGDGRIDQFAMSCRVLGLDVEIAVMAEIVRRLREAGAGAVRGRLVETDANFPCRDLFLRCGFRPDGGGWMLPPDRAPDRPAHIQLR